MACEMNLDSHGFPSKFNSYESMSMSYKNI